MVRNIALSLICLLLVEVRSLQAQALSGHVELGYLSNFYQYSSPNKTQSMNLGLAFNYHVLETKVGFNTNFSKELITTEKIAWNDSVISLEHKLKIFPENQNLSAKGRLGVTIGNSEKSRKEKSMYSIIALSTPVTWSPENTSITLLPTIGKVINKFKTKADGEANPSHYIKLTLNPSYSINDQLSIYLKGSATKQWTENGHSKMPSYATAMGTDLSLTNKMALSFEISTEGSLYKEDGTSLNMNLYNNEISQYSVSVTQEF